MWCCIKPPRRQARFAGPGNEVAPAAAFTVAALVIGLLLHFRFPRSRHLPQFCGGAVRTSESTDAGGVTRDIGGIHGGRVHCVFKLVATTGVHCTGFEPSSGNLMTSPCKVVLDITASACSAMIRHRNRRHRPQSACILSKGSQSGVKTADPAG